MTSLLPSLTAQLRFPSPSGLLLTLEQVTAIQRAPQPTPEPAPSLEPAPALLPQATPPGFGVEALSKSGPAHRRDHNDAALTLARTLERAGRLPNVDERALLAQFSGEGGLGHLSAYFTPLSVAGAIWKLLGRAGLEGGKILEPSIGMGVFAETAPANVALSGVELDPDSALLTRLLHPGVKLFEGSFEQFTTTQDGPLFDAAIGNPPYGARGLTRHQHKPDLESAEGYFSLAVLERVKPTGLVALLLPAGVMQNATSRTLRAKILCLADLRLAARLPVSTFESVGAHVTPDLWLLERRDAGVGEALLERLRLEGEGALELSGVARQDVLSGHYFMRLEEGVALAGVHPGRVLGEIGLSPRFGQAAAYGPLEEALETLEHLTLDPVTPVSLEQILKNTPTPHQGAVQAASKHNYPIVEGTRSPDGLRVLKGQRWTTLKELEDAGFKAAFELSRALEAFRRDRGALAPLERKARRKGLAERVLGFVTRHGDPHQNRTIARNLRALSSLSHLLSAWDGHALSPDLGEEDASQSTLDLESATLKLAREANLDAQTLSNLSDCSLEVAQAHLWASNLPFDGGKFYLPEHYYWGEAQAEIERLERLIERASGQDRAALIQTREGWTNRLDPWTLERIYFTPRSNFVPLSLLEGWLTDHWDARTEDTSLLSVDRQGTLLRIVLEDGRSDCEYKALGEARDQREAMQAYLNHKTQVKRINDKSQLSEAEYEGARQQAIEEALKFEAECVAAFRTWVEADMESTRLLENSYNQKLRSFVVPQDDEEPLNLKAWSGPRLHPYQTRTVRRLFKLRRGVAGLKVGLGKTLAGLALVAMCREAGQCQRPVITLPKSLLMNWVKNAERALSGSQILTVGVSKVGGKWVQDNPGKILRKLAQIPAQSWDLIVMSRSTFEGIGMKLETRERLILDDLQLQRQRDLYAQTERKKARTEEEWMGSQLAKVRLSREGQLGWEDLGVDLLMHDELHGFKNLYKLPETLGGRPKFMGAGAESNRAMDAHHKGTFVRQAGGRTYGLTGTPTKNSPLELFNLLTLMGEDLSSLGIPSGEDFLDRYCILEPRIVPEKDGSVRSAMAMVGFKNLIELRGVLARNLVLVDFHEARLEDGTPLHVPSLKRIEHPFDLHPEVMEAYGVERRNAMGAKRFDKDANHLFSYFARMRKLTLDAGTLSQSLAELPNPRFLLAAQLAREALERGGKVLMFMDMGGEADARGFDAYDRLVQELVEAGIDRRLIRVATSHTLPSSVARGQLEEDYNAGKVRVIVGSTGTIGEGLNLQVGTTDLINLDVPWDPGTFEQRSGRGARQGNDSEEVREHLLLARGSFDALTYTTLSGKRSWMSLLYDTSVDTSRSHSSGLDLEELALLLSDDPEATRISLKSLQASALEGQDKARMRGLLNRILHWGRVRNQLTTARSRAKRRVRGPTAHDLKGIAWLEASEAKTRSVLERDPEFAPYEALLERKGTFSEHVSGLPLYVGLKVTLMVDGLEGEWTVLEVEEGKFLKLIGEGETIQFGWRDPLPWTAWCA